MGSEEFKTFNNLIFFRFSTHYSIIPAFHYSNIPLIHELGKRLQLHFYERRKEYHES
jgi:hypothetical protein